ncbi:FtsP/CotA-like multicopper oxidase with cupredoxin domain [Geothermobacter ehrlichii]|uniref:FtsP/CotA-like multicopper oxidase with cupredoxin domain n=1 Tax=Geothermobacter ehrlichii TaxID=213224 RepID=A0A5D3WHI1_9BACT|nr:multicopper oxidase family protein [Geothermobacter ehrlichii]TYO96668.1 FtsP/CotA-like multicopper oxidase with cupredoxin domain [Geothermobacter ehrlichii]
MKRTIRRSPFRILVPVLLMILTGVGSASAFISGDRGTTFNLTAKHGHITTGDGGSIPMWGFALDSRPMQYPGPTLIVNEGATITVNLTNQLPEPVSIVFPGQDVTASGGIPGTLTREAPPGGSVTYTFVSSAPGTFTYYSGTHVDFQVEMGLLGALIIRPSGFNEANPATYTAYGDAGSAYDYEYLFLLTDMDPRFHELYEFNKLFEVDTTNFKPAYWFINGRTGPDTLAPANAPWLPAQPFDALARMHPGDRVLIRMIGAGRDLHPFHTHGNNYLVIAKDGKRLLNGTTELGWSDFTQTVVPGKTADGIFTWTGAGMGWDIYGHQQDIDNPPTGNFPNSEDVDHNGNGIFDSVAAEPNEDPADHGLPFPVTMPDQLDLTFGQFFSGSPYLGAMGALPPGEGGFNAFGGYFYMWHSHNEKELTNNDIFPGGMLTMMIVEHPGVFIPHYENEPAP